MTLEQLKKTLEDKLKVKENVEIAFHQITGQIALLREQIEELEKQKTE